MHHLFTGFVTHNIYCVFMTMCMKIVTVLIGAVVAVVVVYCACRNRCSIISFTLMYVVLIKHIFTIAIAYLHYCRSFVCLDIVAILVVITLWLT